ncbi:bifunctional polysaccharide deacetylase/glycosyltransferase family 2 protein [Actinomadura rugatobispora]|uniref:Bifunctional polysaccharide deacetylase/glycosyltransferase family 2 protein n=1 Tax=Actinomadura rugatobispora TaxID=1994 RepID=A0ABW1A5E4_9ACTN|nr:glycosyltransferase [Actinomadura rugatobispora]
MRTRPPKGHWILLLLTGVALFAALLVNGFATGEIGEGTERPGPAGGRAPDAATRAGPVLNLTGGTLRSARPSAGTIALTFDDGPDPEWTPRLLEVLRRHNARATFFSVGSKVARHPGLARRMVREGHEIGSHTYTHVDLGNAPSWRTRLELDLSQRALAGATGRGTRLLRQPFSGTPAALTGAQWRAARDAAGRGYLTVLTDRDTEDWARPGADAIVRRATAGTGRAGAIVMLHDSGGDRGETVRAVEEILERLSARGYRFTTVSESIGLRDGNPPASFTSRVVGKALVLGQLGSGWVVGGLTALFGVAAVLTVLRLVLLLAFARTHIAGTRRARHRRARRGAPPFLPPVSVIVPAYNEEAGIAATIGSLLDTGYPGPLEVIVVDDGSTDRTAEIAASFTGIPGVALIRKPNGGKPSALNAGVARARAEIVVLVDGDTVFQRDTIGNLVAPMADRRVGAVSGNTKVANRGGIIGRWQHIEYVIGFNLDRRLFDVLQCMPTVPGAIGAFRREALAAAGGVPSDTLAEDTDLTMAICRAGWRVVYEETALAWTEAPATLRQLWRQRYRWCYGTLQAMWKHRRALVERGASGRFGRRCLSYLALFQVALPVFAPAVDVFTLYGLLFLDPGTLALTWLSFTALQALAGWYALRLDGERARTLWVLPLQQVVYRQLMYLVVVQSLVTAVLGARLRWQTIRRAGTFDPTPDLPAHQPAP